MSISQKIADEMICMGIISEKEYAVYKYGLELLMSKFIAGGIALAFSLWIKTTVFLLLLLLFLIPIRIYAGGVHASSRKTCLFLTELILIVAQLTWKYNFSTEMFQVMIILLGFFTILMLSPVENEKRKLKEPKRKKFRFFSIVFGGINVGCYAIGIFIECAPIKAATSLAMCIEMFLLLLALPQKLKNEMHDRNHGLDDRPL